MTRAYSQRIGDGHYQVTVGKRTIGEVVRTGPSSPQTSWEARTEGWVAETTRKKHAIDALLGHVIGRNGHASAETTPPPAAEATPPPVDAWDQDRFNTLAWAEIEDRLALTRGLALDMLLLRDTYDPDERQTGILRRAVDALDRTLYAMRRYDEEGVS